uniref:Band 7 domain-containing protein n=1 Tax=Chlamydomonas leiostraca TaxID=1034604 RepID=A0A6T8R3H4_9CHLO|mmetsp:Transcript_21340/g.54333  ORF Transcript_21340/g.54333 Transcript_21340/m.54333 type:complete len:298 (+) Transcript_21340:133-1026(+)|eukprot:CAMPEP_0202861238 /NCGR_PEP_ID=MMETSP1391-20130828/2702_1 /ASSEMBLY_ACC=CAM_ASM_000867 /TAXON_ID=1034604 /ORGANISM="Chlamydomonas leiostraca, Strain SAG 11-49" /LENGTH=297 /DNA_ID=CAMNT_0049540593 /DNA_START=112 /DNA_END=1005 /DNA_ORIENTATION=-
MCMSCCVCPEQETVAFIESCGKFDKVAYPGCNVIWPCCGQASAGTLSLRVQQLDVRCETKTKDNVFVTLVVSVQYQVQKENVYDAFYKLTDSRQQISSYIFDVVRATVPKMNLDDVFVEKEEIAKDIKEELTKSMSTYGYLIIHALVNDIEPAAKVKEAMNDINAARRMRVAALEKAEAEKVAVVKAAEAEAEAKYLQGQGIARQRQAIIAGLRDSVKEFTETSDVSAKDVLELMLITQYFDMLKDVGMSNRASTIFLPHTPGALSDISQQIRGVFMEASVGTEQHRAMMAATSGKK